MERSCSVGRTSRLELLPPGAAPSLVSEENPVELLGGPHLPASRSCPRSVANPPLPMAMAAASTFWSGLGVPPPALQPQWSAHPGSAQTGEQDWDPETWHLIFRKFDPSEPSNPVQDLRILSQLCSRWLRPDLHTKEQILDQLVLEQFMISMPPDLQALVKESGVKSCKDLEEMLENQGKSQKPRTWAIVTLQGQQFLAQSRDAQRAHWPNANASLDRCSSSENQIQSGQVIPQPLNRRPSSESQVQSGQVIPQPLDRRPSSESQVQSGQVIPQPLDRGPSSESQVQSGQVIPQLLDRCSSSESQVQSGQVIPQPLDRRPSSESQVQSGQVIPQPLDRRPSSESQVQSGQVIPQPLDRGPSSESQIQSGQVIPQPLNRGPSSESQIQSGQVIPQPLDRCSSSESQLPSEQVSPQPQSLPGTKRPEGQGEEFFPKTIPEKGAPKDLRCRQNLVKNLLESQKENTALRSPEPQPSHSSHSTRRRNPMTPQEETSMNNVGPGTPPTPVLQRGILAENQRDPSRLRYSKRRPDNSTPTPQEEPHRKAPCPENREFSGHVRSNQPTALQPDGHSDGQAGLEQAHYKCKVCKKVSIYRSQFIIHQRTHTGERPFKCSTCSKGFMQASDLRVHQRIHTGEKPFECQVCGKKFAHESTLHGHRRVHTKEKPYRCEVCKMTFSHKGNLNVHGRIHTDSKPYTCPVCGHTFRQQGTFNRHKKIHEKKPPPQLHDQN